MPDLNGPIAEQMLERLRRLGWLLQTHDPRPPRSGMFAIYLAGARYLLELEQRSQQESDAINSQSDALDSLDVALLQLQILSPLLGLATRVRTDALSLSEGYVARRSWSAG